MGQRGYRIWVKGRLSEKFTRGFEGVAAETGVGETAFVGNLDQSQLHGVLDRVRDLGLELLRVEEVTG